jgi:hypothetical protein
MKQILIKRNAEEETNNERIGQVNELKYNRISATTNEKQDNVNGRVVSHPLQHIYCAGEWKSDEEGEELVTAEWTREARTEEDVSDEMKERQKHTYRRFKTTKTGSSLDRPTQAK